MEQLVRLQPSVRVSAADSEKGTEIKRCGASSLVSWRGSFCTRSLYEEQKIQTQLTSKLCHNQVSTLLPQECTVQTKTLHHSWGGGGLKFRCTGGGRRVEGQSRGVRRSPSLPSRSRWFPRWRVRRGSWGCVAPVGRCLGLYPPGGAAASAGRLGREPRSCKGSRKASW